MEQRKKKQIELPSMEQVEAERARIKKRVRYSAAVKSLIVVLLVAAAVTVLVTMLWMPVLEIYGNSMAPTLREGQTVAAWRPGALHVGDVVAFQYGNKILVKRIIAGPGSTVSVAQDGSVTVDGQPLDEPYVAEQSLGMSNVEYPCLVPEDCYFVMGDRRTTSVDSRTTEVGCISKEQIIGKIVFKIWPLSDLGTVN